MSLVQATEVTALVIGIGGAGAVIYKGASALRRLGHFIDKLAGNGDSEPGVLKRLEDLKKDTEALKSAGAVRDKQLVDLTDAVQHQGEILVQHIDGDSKTWLQEGQEWGKRLEAHLGDHDRRIARLEGQDPVIAPQTGQ